jgi:hypothetical protein
LAGLFAESLRAQLSQGDIYPDSWIQGAPHIVVLNNDCDIDKSDRLLAIEVIPDDLTPKGILGDIKRGRVFHALYLEGLPAGGWANLRTITGVSRTLLLENLSQRSHSMTDEGRVVLAAKVFSFLTRSLPPSLPGDEAKP